MDTIPCLRRKSKIFLACLWNSVLYVYVTIRMRTLNIMVLSVIHIQGRVLRLHYNISCLTSQNKSTLLFPVLMALRHLHTQMILRVEKQRGSCISPGLCVQIYPVQCIPLCTPLIYVQLYLAQHACTLTWISIWSSDGVITKQVCNIPISTYDQERSPGLLAYSVVPS